MSMRLQPRPPVSETMAAAGQDDVPAGNLYEDLCAASSKPDAARIFTGLHSPGGRCVNMAARRLAVLEARDRGARPSHWVGSMVHLTDIGDGEHPDFTARSPPASGKCPYSTFTTFNVNLQGGHGPPEGYRFARRHRRRDLVWLGAWHMGGKSFPLSVRTDQS